MSAPSMPAFPSVPARSSPEGFGCPPDTLPFRTSLFWLAYCPCAGSFRTGLRCCPAFPSRWHSSGVHPSPAARIASSLRSRKEQNTTTGCSAATKTTKPLMKSTSCCGSRSCGLYEIKPQRKGRQTCRFSLCDLKIMNLLQNQRGRCIDSGSQLLIEHIQTLGVSAE